MSKILMLVFALTLAAGFTATGQEATAPNQSGGQTMDAPKILVAYFSRTGNTRAVAERIQSAVGGDLFEIATADPYPEEYRAATEQARAELDSGHRPALAAGVDDMAAYGVVYIGYPCWWGTMPMALFTFFEQYDFSGKTVVPFCTHEGSGLGRSVDDIRKLCPDATVLQALAVRGSSAGQAEEEVTDWLRRIGQLK